jgi:hypothetical protein
MFMSKFLTVPELLDLLAMFHNNMLDHIKSEIQKDLCDHEGNSPLLLCTSAVGMELNFSIVNHAMATPTKNLQLELQIFCSRQVWHEDNERT